MWRAHRVASVADGTGIAGERGSRDGGHPDLGWWAWRYDRTEIVAEGRWGGGGSWGQGCWVLNGRSNGGKLSIFQRISSVDDVSGTFKVVAHRSLS
jgi:hypothetical protein